MIQCTLDEYFVTDSRRKVAVPRTAFLHLPYSLHRRIYEYAGLIEGLEIYLNYLAPDPAEICPQSYLGSDLGTISPQDDISSYSESVSRFLDGPLPWPKIHLNRRCRCRDVPGLIMSLAIAVLSRVSYFMSLDALLAKSKGYSIRKVTLVSAEAILVVCQVFGLSVMRL
jgi:hypothetical protein